MRKPMRQVVLAAGMLLAAVTTGLAGEARSGGTPPRTSSRRAAGGQGGDATMPRTVERAVEVKIVGVNPEISPAAPSAPEPIVTVREEAAPAARHPCVPASAAGPGWHQRAKARLQASHWGYPEYFNELPLGTLVRAHMDLHVAKGYAARMVLYHCDFETEDFAADRLNPYGHRRLARITWLPGFQASPLVIQATLGNPALDEARRRYVLAELEHGGIPVLEELVIIGEPAAPGASGVEARIHYQSLLGQTQAGGSASGGETRDTLSVMPVPGLGGAAQGTATGSR